MGGVSASFRYPRRWIVCGSLPVVTAGLLILFVSVTISSGVLLDGRRASLGLRRAPSDRTGILNSLRRFNSANGNQGDSHADDGNDAERVWSLYGFSQIGQSGSQGGRKRSGASGKGKSSGIFSKARISRLGLKRKVELPSGTQGSYKKLESPAGAVGTATPPPPKEDDVSLVERIGVTSVGEEVKTGDDSDSSPGDSYGFFQAGASDARSRAAGLWRRLMKAYRKRKRETAALARGAAQTLRRASSRLSDRVRSRLSSVASPTSLVPPEGFPDTGRTPTSPRMSTSVLVATGQGTAETPEARSQELTLASPPLSPVFYSTGFENFEPPPEIPECTLRPDLEVLREGQKNLHLAETALTANSEVDPNLQEALDSVLPPNQRVPVRSRDGSTGVLRQTAFVRKNRDTLEVLVTLTPDNSESEQLFSATFVYRTETAGTSEDQMQGQAESILHRQITGDETVGLAAHTDVQLLRRIGVGLTSGVYRVAPDADMFARAPGPVATGPHIYRRLFLRPPTRMRLSEVDQRLLSAEGLQYVVYSILQMVGALNDLRFVLSSISLEDFGIHPLTGQIFLVNTSHVVKEGTSHGAAEHILQTDPSRAQLYLDGHERTAMYAVESAWALGVMLCKFLTGRNHPYTEMMTARRSSVRALFQKLVQLSKTPVWHTLPEVNKTYSARETREQLLRLVWTLLHPVSERRAVPMQLLRYLNFFAPRSPTKTDQDFENGP